MASRFLERAAAIAVAAGKLIGFGSRAAAPAGPVGDLLNQPLRDVVKNAFFGWFHLGETRREPLPGGGEKIDFQPTGERFHDLALVIVEVNAATLIQRIELVLKRSFIASPRDGIFAADIARSFIVAALPSTGAEELSTLANEIAQRARSSQTVIVGPGYNPPKVSDRLSPAYQVYADMRPSYAKKVAGCRFCIENRRSSGDDRLAIHFTVS